MPVDRGPGSQGAEILEAPPQTRGTPAKNRELPADRRSLSAPSVITELAPPAKEKPPAKARRRWLRWALFLLLPVGLIVAAYFYFEGGDYVSTDDAYIQADQVGLSTDVSGMVKSVDVKDNQHVAAGQVLFRLDPAPFQLKLDQAQAQLGIVRDNLNALKQEYRQVEAQITQAQDQIAFNQQQYDRQATLAKKGFAAQVTLDQARLNLQNSVHSWASLKAQLASVLAKLHGDAAIPVEQYPEYRQALATRDEAARELRDTVIRAPFAGTVTNVPALRPGMYLPAATTGFYLVDTDRIWVQAQPKETELTYVRPGQPAAVTVDTYPGRVWHGRVASIGPAAQSQFSLLPAQNTSGNWVKVVQRIPLRVEISQSAQQGLPPLRSGMSAEVSVHTGHKRGLPLFLSALFGGDDGNGGAGQARQGAPAAG